MDLDARLLTDLLLDRKRADRELGQHYLHDGSIADRAVELCLEAASPLNSSAHVIEVGPGPGSLTLSLLGSGATITAIEIDAEAIDHLGRMFPEEISSGRLNLIEGDALEVAWPESTHVVANIPYSISSPLIERIRRDPSEHRAIVLLLQEEFARRLAMSDGPIDRGPLGINTWLDHDVKVDRRVPPHCFAPSPRVHSRLVTLTPASRKVAGVSGFDARLFRMVVSHCFAERRKKIRNRLRRTPSRIARIKGWNRDRWQRVVTVLGEDGGGISSECGLELPKGWLDLRPEMLSPTDWVLVSMLLSGESS